MELTALYLKNILSSSVERADESFLVKMGVFQLVSESAMVRFVAAVVGGALLGLILSFVVNCTLVEISLNPLFAWYFGFLFLVVGGVIIFRVSRHVQTWRRIVLYAFSGTVVTAGILCLMFSPRWIFTLPKFAKILVYGVLGISSCFAITFSLLDLLNFCFLHCMNPDTPALIESIQQVNLIMATSAVMGLGYGVFFGLLDVGKRADTSSNLRHQLLHEEMFCVPLGIVVGALGAAANEYIRNREITRADYKYSPIFNDDEDDDNLI